MKIVTRICSAAVAVALTAPLSAAPLIDLNPGTTPNTGVSTGTGSGRGVYFTADENLVVQEVGVFLNPNQSTSLGTNTFITGDLTLDVRQNSTNTTLFSTNASFALTSSGSEPEFYYFDIPDFTFLATQSYSLFVRPTDPTERLPAEDNFPLYPVNSPVDIGEATITSGGLFSVSSGVYNADTNAARFALLIPEPASLALLLAGVALLAPRRR